MYIIDSNLVLACHVFACSSLVSHDIQITSLLTVLCALFCVSHVHLRLNTSKMTIKISCEYALMGVKVRCRVGRWSVRAGTWYHRAGPRALTTPLTSTDHSITISWSNPGRLVLCQDSPHLVLRATEIIFGSTVYAP